MVWGWFSVVKYGREILIFILLAGLVFTSKCAREKDRKIHDLNALYKISQGETEQWRDKEGNSRARAITAEIDARNVKYVLDDNLKKLEKEIGSLKKNLISYSRISTVTEGSFKAPVRDTVIIRNMERIEAKAITFKDEFLEFSQLVLPDSTIAKYTIRNDFEYYSYYRKPGKWPFNLFKRKEAVAEIKFKNPNTRGDKIYTLILKRKKSKRRN